MPLHSLSPSRIENTVLQIHIQQEMLFKDLFPCIFYLRYQYFYRGMEFWNEFEIHKLFVYLIFVHTRIFLVYVCLTILFKSALKIPYFSKMEWLRSGREGKQIFSGIT